VGLQPLQRSASIQGLNNATISTFVETISTTYNGLLQVELGALQLHNPRAKIQYVDIYTPLLEALTGQRPDLGLVELQTPCLQFKSTFDLLVKPLPVTAPRCSDPKVVANYDILHLNSVIQTKVVAEVIKAHLAYI
jgi:hypothetical protein